jgi:hypothetical protein
MAKAEQVKRALELYSEEIGQKKNVVGLGRVPAEAAGEWELAVYVDKKLPEAEIAPSDLVPRELEIPGKKRKKVRVKTKVIEQGVVSLE